MSTESTSIENKEELATGRREAAGRQERPEVVQRPLVSTHEDENGVYLKVALPGVSKENIKLSVHHLNLQIQADRGDAVPEDWKPVGDAGPRVRYELNARLTERLDGNAVSADLSNGVLSLHIPLREEAKPRQISIR
jgi:HSP20 family protein